MVCSLDDFGSERGYAIDKRTLWRVGMAENAPVNLYTLILGLPEHTAEPDHYQILGIPRYTEDPQTIRDAAVEQNGRILRWQNSEHYEGTKELMRRVVEAKQVLGTPKTKREYDAQLRRVERSRRPAETETLSNQPTRQLPSKPPSRPPSESHLPVVRRAKKSGKVQPRRVTLGFVYGVVLGMFAMAGVCVVLIVVLRSGSNPSPQERPAVPETSVDDLSNGNTPSSAVQMPDVAEASVENPSSAFPQPQGASHSSSSGQNLPTAPVPLQAPFDELIAQSGQKTWANFLGQDVVRTNSVGMKLVLIPPGEFLMGSQRVQITKAFLLGQTEVTQAQWQQVMQTTPWTQPTSAKEGAEIPAIYVSWEDAAAFCQKLTAQERQSGHLPEGWEYVLPTEAQWEYACRAGTSTAYSFGNEESELGDFGWYGSRERDGNTSDEPYAHAVGQKEPNPWGLYDMHGNVWEWCRDWLQAELPGGADPEVRSQQSPAQRVNRGGSWFYSAKFCRSEARGGFAPGARSLDLGFRVARVQSARPNQ